MKFIPIRSIKNTRVVLRDEEILRICKNKKILHLGCVDFPITEQRGKDLLHKKLAKITNDNMLWGLDINKEGVDLLCKMGFKNVIHGDVEQLGPQLLKEKFDVILAGEIIEHLENPGLFLKSITPIMAKGTELLLTTVNTPTFRQVILSILRKEKVHHDHNYYFSYFTIKQLLEKCGLKCVEISYYKIIKNNIESIMMFTVALFTPVLSDGLIIRAVCE